MRQVTGSAIRFTSYSTLKSLVSGPSRPNETLPSGFTFGLGATSGILTVLFTQPLEYVNPFILTHLLIKISADGNLIY